MTSNMKMIVDTTISMLLTKKGDDIPTLDEINEQADETRTLFSGLYPVSDEEFAQIKKHLAASILHKIGDAHTLRGKNTDGHKPWYFLQENDGYYWGRYRDYLLKIKHWSMEVVTRLHNTTDNVMDDLGNPRDHERSFQRRGLLLGDVQSGKTATYTAICNKAADAGYRVIIVLAGIMENLRVQTQERLDKELVGLESKYTLDKKADSEIRYTPVGVGKMPNQKETKRIACFTSVATDFNKNTLTTLGLSLKTLNGTALFVVKKNKTVLNNLSKWLKSNNMSPGSDVIDLPLLLIDDEADNASVNTNSEDKDPTAINKAIREILHCFRQASYLGITATPFANIFINPESEQDEAERDLFPKDFLTVLPTPERYIGADKIFGNGDADEWDTAPELALVNRVEGEYGNALIPIRNDEQANFFVFKHKKDLADTLEDIPASMREAIRYFVIATAISDYRKDNNEHRSMLINVSRYTKVQNTTAEIVEDYVTEVKNNLENYSQLPADQAMQIHVIAHLHDTWMKYCEGIVADTPLWEDLLKNYLTKAAKRIEVRAVNQLRSSSALDYHTYEGIGMRVIAVGGNSLSRGLTLEGLCVSYFYRNTMMYDTLLQMGRWFGYRENYDDIFKIWMAEDTIDWFGYITDAVNELKDELRRMERMNATPEEFGLKVRQAPGSLLITARNKMRSAVSVSRPITVSGRMLETPCLRDDAQTISANEQLCRGFIKTISASYPAERDEYTKAYIWRNVPKAKIIDLVRDFVTHAWSLSFQSGALADYIAADDDKLSLWDVAIPFGADTNEEVTLDTFDEPIHVHAEKRQMETGDPSIKHLVRINGHHVRVGTGGCSKIGLSEARIKELRKSVSGSKATDRTYLIADRNPLALIHFMVNSEPDKEPKQLTALGLGFPDNGIERTANYMVNTVELKNWVDETVYAEEDDDENN